MAIRRLFILKARHKYLELGLSTRIMGVLNVTPDSFSHDGLLRSDEDVDERKALRIARRMIKEGADIIDVGGESSRPGSKSISVKEEIRRIVPVIDILARKTDAIISVDTYKHEVARVAFAAGAHMLNLIKGVPASDNLIRLCGQYGAAVILMHMRGDPRNMQSRVIYNDVLAEVIAGLKRSVEKCYRFGLNACNIVVDPGIGFAKTCEQNLFLLNKLSNFRRIGCPILVGTSRKSFIGKILELDVDERLLGTAASVVCAVHNGAHIVRVHDVQKIKQVVMMADAIINSKGKVIL